MTLVTRDMLDQDHKQAARTAMQREAVMQRIEADHRQAALRATVKQRQHEVDATARGMHVDEYLRATNQYPSMERVELDHVRHTRAL